MRRAQGRAVVQGRDEKMSHRAAHQVAFDAACDDWVAKHGEHIPWDDLNIRGGHTTVTVVIEFEEVQW